MERPHADFRRVGTGFPHGHRDGVAHLNGEAAQKGTGSKGGTFMKKNRCRKTALSFPERGRM
jgi:hypothetical protein